MALDDWLPGEGRSGASLQGVGVRGQSRAWLIRHAQTFFYALGKLSSRPLSTLMTAAVIGIALALPAGMQVMIQNVQQVLKGWDSATQISLFLKHDLAESRATQLAQQLERRPDIAAVTYISREQALAEFKRLSGFGGALDALDDNPLPPVLVVRPRLERQDSAQVERLVKELGEQAEVNLAQLDMEWIKRLFALMEIGKRGVWVLATLLALAVLLVVGNTIRLMIQNQRDEIIITKLIGGTDAFIRRPFLYTGFWYGLFGGLVALFLVLLSLGMLKGPIQHLAVLYQSEFRLTSMDAATVLLLLGGATLLGLLGSWLAVGRHLKEIEPT